MVILEVAIGIVFLFMLVSIICSAIREGIESLLKTRAAYLERGIRQLLHDPDGTGLAKDFYEHPLIGSLYPSTYDPQPHSHLVGTLDRGRNLPAYIPAANFAVALMDLAARGADPAVASHPDGPKLTVSGIRANVLDIENVQVRRALLTAVDAAQNDLNRVQQNLEAWYDSGMDRVSGWYKKSTQNILFGIGFVVALLLNINVITVADYLYRDDTARSAVMARVETIAGDSSVLDDYNLALAQLDTLTTTINLPIGWAGGWGSPLRGDEPRSHGFWNDFANPLLGWLITAFAATFGAPFWFDLLNKMMVVRSTVKPREKSQDEGSEDGKPAGHSPGRPVIEAGSVPATAGAAVPGAAAAAGAVPDGGGGGGGGGGGVALAPPEPALTRPAPVDGCDIDMSDVTPDEELPPAEGGVSS